MTRLVYSKFSRQRVFNPNGGLVSDALATKVLGAEYATKRNVKKPQCVRKSVYPLEVILESRRLFEQVGLPIAKVHQTILEHGYNVNFSSIRNWCFYITSRHDEPAPNAAPYLPIKTSVSE